MSETTIINNVLVGDNRELYLAGGNHGILSYAKGEWEIKPQSIVNWYDNIARRKAYCSLFNVPYAHMVVPEKYRVMNENFPLPDARSMADFYRRDGALPCLYPVKELKACGRAYMRNDTHFAVDGLFAVMKIVANLAGRTDAETGVAVDAATKWIVPSTTPFGGDLGAKLTPPDLEPEVRRITKPEFVRSFENNLEHVYDRPVNEGRIIVVESDLITAKGKLLIFGDSYLHHALYYLSCLFKTVIFCRTQYFHEEIAFMAQPDVIVSQQAERYLSWVSRDDAAAPLLFTPYLLERTPRLGVEEAEAFSRAFAGRRKVDLAGYNRYRAKK